ncbi:hypothetical protein THAOC_16539 [Thalassiosira oceanica]|uniref:Uncharacterized protein n=1 Tax=Thalassiosira oceanica TaxID=159749 RepID=K0SBX5_THAOC|nr:hypothetical protein THAOC_16539 [Thalassiosira oceanica]|eukprot:EJK62835.1 hypothetical protein THAOC_16539 [Thalassiosira oceanica]
MELPAIVLKELRLCLVAEGLGHVDKLHLEWNEFQGSDGVDFALEIMQSQTKMTQISYVRNPVYNGQDCQILIDAIVSHPNISSCQLECVCGRERNGHDYLVDLLRKEEMKNVDFSNCGVTTNSQSTLFEAIKFHPNLARLSLGENNLNDEDAFHLADALRYNRTLDNLSLGSNEFTERGEIALLEVIYDDSSLNAVADSNHICTIDPFGLYQRDRHDRLLCNDGPKSRAQKIFNLLRERNIEGTNVYYMEREISSVDTLKVVPFVLEAAQIYGEQWRNRGEWGKSRRCRTVEDAADLSITYELLRSWNATLLHDGPAATQESDATQSRTNAVSVEKTFPLARQRPKQGRSVHHLRRAADDPVREAGAPPAQESQRRELHERHPAHVVNEQDGPAVPRPAPGQAPQRPSLAPRERLGERLGPVPPLLDVDPPSAAPGRELHHRVLGARVPVHRPLDPPHRHGGVPRRDVRDVPGVGRVDVRVDEVERLPQRGVRRRHRLEGERLPPPEEARFLEVVQDRKVLVPVRLDDLPPKAVVPRRLDPVPRHALEAHEAKEAVRPLVRGQQVLEGVVARLPLEHAPFRHPPLAERAGLGRALDPLGDVDVIP